MQQTIINGVNTTYLSTDQCSSIAELIEKTQVKEKSQASLAYFLLVDYKQDLIDNNSFEALADLRKLELWHKFEIPFLDLKGHKVGA